jgi:hypothetical protein
MRGTRNGKLIHDTSTISDYLDDPKIPLKNKGQPWLSLAHNSGVEVPETWYFKPPGYRIIEPQTYQRACLHDKDPINTIRHEKKDLTPV